MITSYFAYVGAVYAFFILQDEILLLKRANTGYQDGMRSLPAGHMDGGELPREAIVREIKEEVGIDLRVDQLVTPITLFRITNNNNGTERIEFFFPITNRDGTIVNCEPHKCDAIERYNITNLPDTTIPYISTMIQCYQSGKTFVEINEQTGELFST